MTPGPKSDRTGREHDVRAMMTFSCILSARVKGIVRSRRSPRMSSMSASMRSTSGIQGSFLVIICPLR